MHSDYICLPGSMSLCQFVPEELSLFLRYAESLLSFLIVMNFFFVFLTPTSFNVNSGGEVIEFIIVYFSIDK